LSTNHARIGMVNLYINGRVIILSEEQSLRDQIIQKAWEDEEFKKQLLENPKKALKEAFNIDVPDNIELEAVEETANKLHLVIPPNPSETSEDDTVNYPMWQ
jgi:hypothetical protein